MKIHYCSDLHLDFKELTLRDEDYGEVLILAGDILELRSLGSYGPDCSFVEGRNYNMSRRYWGFLREVCERFRHVVYVMGNHEYYGGRWDKCQEVFFNLHKFSSNIYPLEREAVDINGVRVLGSTLWTSMNKADPVAMLSAASYMRDYSSIKRSPDSGGYGKLRPSDTVRDHKISVEWLKSNIKQGDVVVTHHLPTFYSIPDHYRQSHWPANYFYFSDLDELIWDSKPAVWIHGHTHDGFDYQHVGRDGDVTRILCNPRGYVGYESIANNFKIKSFEL